MPFWLSIACLSLVQGAIVALPVPVAHPLLARLRGGGWAIVLPASVVGFVFLARAAESASAQGLTYLALAAVPPLALLALGWLSRGARARNCLLAVVLFALAWANRGGLAGNAAATVLSALSCVALGSLLGAVTPARWLAAGIVLMALADTALVVSDLLQRPNDTLNAAAPAAGLPRLQSEVVGSAVMGYGDAFVAGVLGGLLASHGGAQGRGALLTVAFALAFDLLFFAVNELPATVPVAVAMLATFALSRRGSAAGRAAQLRTVLRPGRSPAPPG